MKIQRCTIFPLTTVLALVLFSCVSGPADFVPPQEILMTEEGEPHPHHTPPAPPTPSRLRLTFGGDIMAHIENFRMADYSMIYADIEEIIKNDDLSFANLETPVHGGRPYESYPTFNVQPPYAQAAIDAGFDVFSLAFFHIG